MSVQTEALVSAPAPELYAYPLAQAHDPHRVGAKAYTLGQMLGLGIRVPPSFVVCDDAFQEFLDQNDLRSAIVSLCSKLDPASPDELRKTSQAIRATILKAEIPDAIRREVTLLRARMLAGLTLIVRSSAVGEDSGEASFAGQLDSYPNVNSTEELDEALLACWASYWSERSLFYQWSRHVRLNGMGVVIQEMVRSKISGVLFTRSPDGSDKAGDRLLVEYCFGYGEALVSGRINPGRFTILRTDLSWQKEVSPDQPSNLEELLFRNGLIALLARIGMRLERHFGAPQDIEWTVDDKGNLFIVQSRPITAQGAVSAEHNFTQNQASPGQSMVIWSNANVNENFPEPISPLLYSIASVGYYYYFRNLASAFGISRHRLRAMEHQLRNIIGVHGGRMYYNLTHIHSAFRSVPFGERLIDDFNHFVGATQKAQRPGQTANEEKNRARRLAQSLELAVIVFKTLWQYLFLSKRVETFERRVLQYSERTKPERLKERSRRELLDDFRAFLEIRFHRWTDAALADAATMICYGMLKRVINREFPSTDEVSLHNTLLKGLRDIVSSMPALKIWELSRKIQQDSALNILFQTKPNKAILKSLETKKEFAEFRRELGDFLENWGFRCSGELMLTVPSFQENPVELLDIIKGYAGVDNTSPAEVIRQQDTERAVETTRILSVLSKKRSFCLLPLLTKSHVARLLLRWTHRSIALRERARLKQALLYSRCRRIVLTIGEKMAALGYFSEPNDVFFLTYQELDQLVCGSAMFPYRTKELVALRKREHAELSAMCPPDTIALPEGTYLSIHNDAHAQPQKLSQTGVFAELRGTSACGGKATARATILKDMSESRLLSPGDVLVARQTDPGWGPVFFLIRGLVLERGGMLSHGAIIAREFGIPSVVGVQNATQRIPQSQIVCVDGDSGLVTIVD
jgi:phosphohistidine swiveling domain-containing protein